MVVAKTMNVLFVVFLSNEHHDDKLSLQENLVLKLILFNDGKHTSCILVTFGNVYFKLFSTFSFSLDSRAMYIKIMNRFTCKGNKQSEF